MAEVHIARDRVKLGVFPLAEVQAGLAAGRFLGSDLGWHAGMENWRRLAEWPELHAPTPTGADPGHPGAATPPAPDAASPTPDAPGASPVPWAGATAADPAAAERPGIPWETRRPGDFVAAIVETVKLVLLDPAAAFTRMRRSGGLGEPLLFVLITGSVGVLFGLFYQLALEALTGNAGGASGMPTLPGGLPATGLALGLAALAIIPLVPMGIVFGAFVGAGITHLCLLLVGGVRQPFEATFRVWCYAYGSTAVLQIVPFCGALIGGIWNLVAMIIGLSKAHEIPAGKAALAVLLPVVVCCGLGVAAVAALIAFGVAAGSAH